MSLLLHTVVALVKRNHTDLAKVLAKETFHDIFNKKNKWIDMDPAVLRKHPELADVFFDLVNEAYKNIGGHIKIQGPASFFKGDINILQVIDLDDDDDADAIKFGKKKPAGIKSVGLGHDGTRNAKDAVIKKSAEEMKRSWYSEMSDAIAHIMITRYNVASVNDQASVEKILGKKVEWVGEHPTGKYPKHTGWYRRKIGGKEKLKILLGRPRV